MNNRSDEELVQAIFEWVKEQHLKAKSEIKPIDARAKAEWITEAVKAFMSKGAGLPYSQREYVVQMIETIERDNHTINKLSENFGLIIGSEWEYDTPLSQIVAEFLYVIFRYHPDLIEYIVSKTWDAEIYQQMEAYCSAL